MNVRQLRGFIFLLFVPTQSSSSLPSTIQDAVVGTNEGIRRRLSGSKHVTRLDDADGAPIADCPPAVSRRLGKAEMLCLSQLDAVTRLPRADRKGVLGRERPGAGRKTVIRDHGCLDGAQHLSTAPVASIERYG